MPKMSRRHKEEVLSALFQLVINRIKWVINHYHGFSNAVTGLVDWSKHSPDWESLLALLLCYASHLTNFCREKGWERNFSWDAPSSLIYDKCPWQQGQCLGLAISTPQHLLPLNWVRDKIREWNKCIIFFFPKQASQHNNPRNLL